MASAPVATYKGDETAAFWFIDEEQTKAWKALFDRDKGKKYEMLAFVHNGEKLRHCSPVGGCRRWRFSRWRTASPSG